MIYKFYQEGNDTNLEVSQSDYTGSKIILKIQGHSEEHISLNKNQLYDLIGALHSLQTKINKRLK